MVGRLVVAVVLFLVGVVWIGQGVGWIHGSTMTGEAFWAVMGVPCIVGSGVLLRTVARLRALDRT